MSVMTIPQRQALVSARDYGDPTIHLNGRSEFGGWTLTRMALIRKGRLTSDNKITQAGRDAIDSLVPK